MSDKPIPRATYRLQFNEGFGFREAAGIIPYLARLGVSHIYASPYLKARPGSEHGYDIVDHNSLNPELGTGEDFQALVTALKEYGLGQILDFVPNHMGVGGSDNVWWLDVLEWGQDSPFAGYFDIDWESDHRYLQGKLLVPFLGDHYGVVLESGNLELRFDAEGGTFAIWLYGTHKLPICPLYYHRILGREHLELERLSDAFAGLPAFRPHVARRAGELKAELAHLASTREDVAEAVAAAVEMINGKAGEPESLHRLHDLIQEQNWRAAFWRVAADDINYRRFFSINELAGLRMEEPELFDLTHRFVLEMIDAGILDGLRIDHVDGLLDPKGYYARLREKAQKPFYLVIEKILARHEYLREDWPIEGTTGYEFANLVGGLFVDPAGEEEFTRIYREFTGQVQSFEEIVRQSKLHIMDHEMGSELHVLARDAGRVARSNWSTCDFTNDIMHAGLREIVARFPVYRTYIDGSEPTEADRRDMDWAVSQARRARNAPDASAFDYLQALLTTGLVAEPRSGYSRQAVVRLAMKVQQYSGPVMAKGLEDTAFYRYNRFVALNEVGGHPDHFGVSLPAFHHANAERGRRWPDTMLGTSTHDTKRGEDTRARLYALSELPGEWERQVQAWSRMTRARRGGTGGGPPDSNDEYLLYQLLLGAWPAELTGIDRLEPEAVAAFAGRITGAMVKSVREAKVHSNWATPDEQYEEALKGFIRDCLDVSRHNPFLEMFLPFQARIARLGVINSLAQLLLKLTVPGMPDIYQGTELWDLSLVDPDNRRPVDYELRQALLNELDAGSEQGGADMADLLERWQDGRVKLALMARVLELRRMKPDLFARGSYEPLETAGKRSDQICAFARAHGGDEFIVAVPRLVAAFDGRMDWGDTRVKLPAGTGIRRWQNHLTGDVIEMDVRAGSSVIRAEVLFKGFPAALLIPAHAGTD